MMNNLVDAGPIITLHEGIAQRRKSRERFGQSIVCIEFTDQHHLDRMCQTADRRRRCGWIDRVAQSEKLGFGCQKAQSRAPSDVFDDGTVDHDPVAGRELEHQTGHIKLPPPTALRPRVY